MKSYKHLSGILMLACAGCGYGLMAPLVRIANTVVSPCTSVALRYSLVSLILFVVIICRREVKAIAPHSLRDVLVILLVGLIGTGLSNVAFSLSVLSTTIGNAVLLFSLYTVFTPLLAGLVLREWPTHSQWFGLVLAMIGTSLLTGFLTFTISIDANLGNALAIAGALLVSIQYVGTRVMQQRSPFVISLYLSMGSVIVSLPKSIVVSQHSQIALSKVANIAITTPVWLGWTALFALTLMNLSVNLLVTQGFRSVPASYGSILLLLEPVVALLIGTFLFNEPVQPLGLFGSALIFIGGFVAIWSAGRIIQRKAKVNLSSGLQRSLEDFKKAAHSQSL